MLTELVFKQVEEAGVIRHVSDPVQVTGDFGLQLKFIASKNDFYILHSMNGTDYSIAYFSGNTKTDVINVPVRGIIPGMYIKISSNTEPASGKILMSE